jgi:outer membrane biosynthesis protein TonB
MPAVACKWSDSTDPNLAGYRLRRGGDGERHVVYRGKETFAVDATVQNGHRYFYRAEAVNRRGRTIGISDVVKIAVPPMPEPIPLPEPQPIPLPEPEPQPIPLPEPKPRPEPKPIPRPEPKPIPEPRPIPEPKPIPEPEPRPVPERLKLACRVMPGDRGAPETSELARPQPAVGCHWSAANRLMTASDHADNNVVAGYQLWRAERNSDKKVVFRSRTETSYIDTDVLAGHAYGYLVQALDARGHVIASSEFVRVEVPGPGEPEPTPRPEPKPVEPKPEPMPVETKPVSTTNAAR